jgi:predicted thioesterase
MRVRIVGEHTGSEENRVFVRCRAENELEELIGEGETVQVVLPQRKLDERFRRLQARWEAAQVPGREPCRRSE